MNNAEALLERLSEDHALSLDEYEALIAAQTPDLAQKAAALADRARREIYGNKIYVRGLIEIGNVCRNDCYYCGIRRSNKSCDRYVLDDETILACRELGAALV